MRITDITTTMLAAPGYRPIQDATMPPPRSQTSSRSALFVHVHTDAGVEGLGFGSALPAVRSVVETNLKDLLIGEDPFAIEKHWEAMFWQVRHSPAKHMLATLGPEELRARAKAALRR